jgi:hypothetical protein
MEPIARIDREDGARHLVKCRAGPAAIHIAEVDRQRIAGRWRPWSGADLIHIARPRNHEGLLAPHIFEQRAVRPLRSRLHT